MLHDDNIKVLPENTLRQLISISHIGVWVWNLSSGVIHYSKEYANLLGYESSELKCDVTAWEGLVLPDDLDFANDRINDYLSGKTESYVAEFRMVKKDGTIIWAQDKGSTTEYDEDGNPLVFCGVLQDVTRLKKAELDLVEQQHLLNLAIEVAEFGMWNWEPQKDTITYNQTYLDMVGYSDYTEFGTLDGWDNMNHPDDRDRANGLLDDYLSGKTPKYECEIRVRHRDGHYIWVRDVGKIMSRDSDGNVTHVIGGHLNINNLKCSQEALTEALAELEAYKTNLEEQIERRTKTLTEQDKMLLAVNNVSQRLVALEDYTTIGDVVSQCLEELCKASGRDRISIWRNHIEDGEIFSKNVFSWNYGNNLGTSNIADRLKNIDLSSLTGGVVSNEQKESLISQMSHYSDNVFSIRCEIHMPSIYKYMLQDQILNCYTTDLSPTEKLFYSLADIKSVVMSPINLKGELWGFILMDEKSDKRLFSEVEENMLRLSGSLFANTLHRAEIDEELRQAHEEALMSSKAKSNFLANMSHEIRTPMNAISGMAEIILRESNGRGVAEYASDIKTSCDNLLAIINDILDISKIESGKLDIVNREYYLSSMFNDIINMTRMRIGNKPLSFFTYIDSKLPAKLIGDEIRLKQILINLLGNAIKFTPSGHFGFKVTGNGDCDKFCLKIEVFDSGVGIKKKDIGRLFEEFERVNTTRNRNIEGTGLGLAITKRLCEMMGGSIVVDSAYGKGSVFSITVEQRCKDYEPIASCVDSKSVLLYEPREIQMKSVYYAIDNLDCDCTVCVNQSSLLEQLSESEFDYIFTPSLHLHKILDLKQKLKLRSKIVALSELLSMEQTEGVREITLPANCIQVANVLNDTVMTGIGDKEFLSFVAPEANILVVDDNAVNLKVASGLMEPYKFNIDTALSGFEAIKLVQNKRYDIVFMDHMMPEMDGIDTSIAIRKLDGDYYKNLPIVALTANAVVGARELFIKEGLSDFLSKPIELAKLNEVLMHWLPSEKLLVAQKNEKIVSDSADMLDINIRGLDASHGIGLLGGNTEMYLDILKTYFIEGKKKLAVIEDFYKRGDISSFKTEVHAIKSSSASIGALSLSAKAAQMEQAAQNMERGYIDHHIKNFFASFACILNGIEDHFGTAAVENEQDKTAGDTDFLAAKVKKLGEAVNFVDIVAIETILGELSEFEWDSNITKLLSKTQSAIESYDYDEAAGLIEEIADKI